VQMDIGDNAILEGTLLSLLLVVDNKGCAKWSVLIGMARLDGGKLCLDFGSNKPLFEIFPEWYGHIKKVPAHVKSILRGAEYYLPLIVGDMPENDKGFYTDIDLKWSSRSA